MASSNSDNVFVNLIAIGIAGALGLFVLACVVFVLQWIWVCIVFIVQAFLFPFFVYLLPAIAITVTTIALYWGSWVAVKNYFNNMRSNIRSEGFAGKITNIYIIGILSLIIIASYLAISVTSAYFIRQPVVMFTEHVNQYYAGIQFPYFRIKFPFWD